MQIIKSSIAAGAMISIATIVYLNCSNPIVGAFLFSIGLLTIFTYKFSLYTGKIGAVTSPRQLPRIAAILVGNACGALVSLAAPHARALEVWSAKAALPLDTLFWKAVICGAIIQICVYFNNKGKPQFCLVGVPAFILGGTEHSIADMCFAIAAHDFGWNAIVAIAVVAFGNAVGAIIMKRLEGNDVSK